MTTERTWTDDQLRVAVATATSWRGVLRELGLSPSGGGSGKMIRRRARELCLDTRHFRRNRSWSDDELHQALSSARCWDDALTALGLSPVAGGSRAHIKAHALRLGLDVSHLERPAPPAPQPARFALDLAHLRYAAEPLAGAWFAACGCEVAVPSVPCPYDLLVMTSEGIKRVQVKTTICSTKEGWMVSIARRTRILLRTYQKYVVGSAAGLRNAPPRAA